MRNLTAVLTVIFIGTLLGCSNNAEEKVEIKTLTAEELSYRKTTLLNEQGVAETIPDAEYGKDSAGTSQKIERAFDNAPPMIPHDVEGMLPITKDYNACLDCHLPEIAPVMNATPIPQTHFTNFRPEVEYKNGNFSREVDDASGKVVAHELGELYQGRFNCSQCHAPQAVVDPLVENVFEGGFRNENGKSSSNLMNTINEGVSAD
jgi:cytochrome c-type protein NapB